MENEVFVDIRYWSGEEMGSICDRATKIVKGIELHNEWRGVSRASDFSFSSCMFEIIDLADSLAPTGHIEPLAGVGHFLEDAEGKFWILHPPSSLEVPFQRLGQAVRELYLDVTGADSIALSKGKLVRPKHWSFHNGQVPVEAIRMAVRQLTAALADDVISPNDAAPPAGATTKRRGRPEDPKRDADIHAAVEAGKNQDQVALEFKLTTQGAVSKACARHRGRQTP